MDRISTIKRLQGFMIAFLVSVFLNTLSTILAAFLGVNLPVLINWVFVALALVTYTLLWISYAQSRHILPTTKKYLVLALLLTVLTIIVPLVTMLVMGSISAGALETGLISMTMSAEEITAALANYAPARMTAFISNIITVIANVIYGGLGYVIYSQNAEAQKAELHDYNQKYGG